MGKITSSGAVVNSNLTRSPVPSMGGMFSTVHLYWGQVIEVIYIDDKRNRSKKYVEYNVLIQEKDMTSAVYNNCKALDRFGDENNFQETVYQPATDAKSNRQKDNTEQGLYRNGAFVLVGFIGGRKESGIIIGGLQHPAIHIEPESSPISKFEGTGSSESRDDKIKELPTLLAGAESTGDNQGQRMLGEFNGIRWNINKDGELTIIFQGVKDTKGQLVDSSKQPTVIKITKEGEFFVLDNLDQEIKISRKDQKIIISDGKQNPNIITIDRVKDKITVESPSKIELISPVSHQVHDNVIMTGKSVKIGGQGANQQVILGNLFMKLFNALVNLFNSHTHPGVSSGLSSTAPPTSSASPMTSAHLSENVKVDQKFSGKPSTE